MKLDAALIARTLDHFEAQVIPDDHPAVPQLNSLFGDHTFFLDANGLNIVERVGRNDYGQDTVQVIKLAQWEGPSRTGLVPHEPEVVSLPIALDSHGPSDAA